MVSIGYRINKLSFLVNLNVFTHVVYVPASWSVVTKVVISSMHPTPSSLPRCKVTRLDGCSRH